MNHSVKRRRQSQNVVTSRDYARGRVAASGGMTTEFANNWLAKQGYPSLILSKAEGVWYMVGALDDDRIDQSVDRCMHIVRLSDMSIPDLQQKLRELVETQA